MQIKYRLCMMWGRDMASVNPLFTGRTSLRGVCPTLLDTASLSCFKAVPGPYVLGSAQTDMRHELCLVMLYMGMSVIIP